VVLTSDNVPWGDHPDSPDAPKNDIDCFPESYEVGDFYTLECNYVYEGDSSRDTKVVYTTKIEEIEGNSYTISYSNSEETVTTTLNGFLKSIDINASGVKYLPSKKTTVMDTPFGDRDVYDCKNTYIDEEYKIGKGGVVYQIVTKTKVQVDDGSGGYKTLKLTRTVNLTDCNFLETIKPSESNLRSNNRNRGWRRFASPVLYHRSADRLHILGNFSAHRRKRITGATPALKHDGDGASQIP